MVPKAPWMWPRCASSRTAVTGPLMLALAVMAQLLCLSARERATAYRPGSRFALEAVEFVSGLDFPPTEALRTAPAGLLGPSFIQALLQLACRKGTAEADSREAPRVVQKHNSAPVTGSRRHRQISALADSWPRRAARSTTLRPTGFTGSWFMARLRSLVWSGTGRRGKKGLRPASCLAHGFRPVDGRCVFERRITRDRRK